MINPDEEHFATGNVFLDDGISLSQLNNQSYEHYQFKHANGTIQKFQLNEGSAENQNVAINAVVILNAERYMNSDFGCVHSTNGTLTQVAPVYSADAKALIFDMSAVTEHFFDFNTLHYGDSKYDINFCDLTT